LIQAVACNIVNAVMTAPSDPSHESFEKFLLWLSPDREQAFKKYGEIMKKMGKYFVRKGCPESEELAGETRDRVIRIISAGQEYPKHEALFYGVASKVWKEFARKPRSEPLPADDLLAIPWQETGHKERQADCLERCLAQLPESERDLIIRYYQGRGRNNIEIRKLLMADHGGENTLRVKAYRIRIKLRAWIETCMNETAK
jgi:DNA-directed RNA polymerase specialized sigma24 family protein